MCPAGPAVITPALCFGVKAGRPAVAARARAMTARGRRTRSNDRQEQRLLLRPGQSWGFVGPEAPPDPVHGTGRGLGSGPGGGAGMGIRNSTGWTCLQPARRFAEPRRARAAAKAPGPPPWAPRASCAAALPGARVRNSGRAASWLRNSV